jgi:hypothetical protein
MRELLRVSMNVKQVTDACAEWARTRTNTGNGTAAQVLLTFAEGGEPTGAEVIFLKKRERKAKASGPANPTTF